MWFIGKKMLITCLLWFLPIHCYAILQYSGIFPQRVRSHCQGNFWFCFPWQCDSTVTENIPEYCKFHSSDLGKNQCKQGIKLLQLKCHTVLELACLKRQTARVSPHRRLDGSWGALRSRIVLWIWLQILPHKISGFWPLFYQPTMGPFINHV